MLSVPLKSTGQDAGQLDTGEIDALDEAFGVEGFSAVEWIAKTLRGDNANVAESETERTALSIEETHKRIVAILETLTKYQKKYRDSMESFCRDAAEVAPQLVYDFQATATNIDGVLKDAHAAKHLVSEILNDERLSSLNTDMSKFEKKRQRQMLVYTQLVQMLEAAGGQ